MSFDRVWKNGDRILIKHPVSGLSMDAIVRGYSHSEIPVIGRGLIIELPSDDFIINDSIFNHMVIFECSIIGDKL